MDLDSSFEEIEEQIEFIQRFLTPKKCEAMELQTTGRDEDCHSILSNNNINEFCTVEEKNQSSQQVQNKKQGLVNNRNILSQQKRTNATIPTIDSNYQQKIPIVEMEDQNSNIISHKTWFLNFQCQDSSRYNYMAKKSKRQDEISFKYQKINFKLLNCCFQKFKGKKDSLVVPYNMNFGENYVDQVNFLANFIRQQLSYQIMYELQRNNCKQCKASEIITLQANGLDNILGIYWLKLPTQQIDIDKYISQGLLIRSIQKIFSLSYELQDQSIIIPYLHWPKVQDIQYFHLLLNKFMQCTRNVKHKRQLQITFLIDNEQQYELFAYQLKKIKYEYLRHGPQY